MALPPSSTARARESLAAFLACVWLAKKEHGRRLRLRFLAPLISRDRPHQRVHLHFIATLFSLPRASVARPAAASALELTTHSHRHRAHATHPTLKNKQSKLGNKWSEVARHIPGRTGQQCAQRWRHKVRSFFLIAVVAELGDGDGAAAPRAAARLPLHASCSRFDRICT